MTIKEQARTILTDRRLIFFPLVFLYSEILLRLFAKEDPANHFFVLLAFSCCYGLFFYALSLLLSGKAKRITLSLILILIALAYTLQSVIRDIFLNYRSFGSLFRAGTFLTGTFAEELCKSIFYALPKLLCFLLPALIYLFAYPRFRHRLPAAFRMKHMALLLIALSLIGTGVTGFLVTRNADGHLYRSHFDFHSATSAFGLATGTRLSATYALFGSGNVDFNEETAPIESTDETPTPTPTPTPASQAGTDKEPAEELKVVPQMLAIDFSAEALHTDKALDRLTNYLAEQRPTMTNEYSGLFAGKNLILICAEAYNSAFISPTLTPTLYRLTHQGFYFEEYYQPEWGGGTTTGEASFLLGLAPKDGDKTLHEAMDNHNYFTMGNAMQREGYVTCAFHNGSYYYYDRHLTHEILGFNQFVANENGLQALAKQAYPDDHIMFDLTMDFYTDRQPFCVYYMTLSGHAPYEKDSPYSKVWYDTVNAEVGDRYAEKTKYYICEQMELEFAMNLMVEKLEAAGIAEDTVIVLVGDHYPYGLGTGSVWNNDQNYIDDLIKGDSRIRYLEDRNSLIIWSACLENEEKEMAKTISSPVTSLDVLPTLLNLFGLPYDSRLLPGRDVFSQAEPLVYWPDMTWVSTEGFYDARTGSYTPREGYTDDPAHRAHIEAMIQDKILMSRSIVDYDYYGLLFGPDETISPGPDVFDDRLSSS